MKGLKLLLCILWGCYGFAQEINYLQQDLPLWAEKMYLAQSPSEINEVVLLYDKYYQEQNFNKNQHTQFYKRWIHSLSRQPDALLINQWARESIIKNRRSYQRQSLSKNVFKSNSAEWIGLGPFDFDMSAAPRSYAPGAAHMYVVKQSLSNPNIIYAGSATAGLWKSINAGQSWSLLTQELFVNTVKSIDISPIDPNLILFGGTGSFYRSTNGGNNWLAISLPGGVHLFNDIRWINSTVILVASDKGLYRSNDQGLTWVLVMGANSGLQDFQEIEVHPTNQNIVYTIKRNENRTEFYKSINGGISFNQITIGWPDPSFEQNAHQRRTEIAVSLAHPDNVYALAAGAINSGSGLYGFYLSTDAGETWNFKCCGTGAGGDANINNQNILGYSNSGSTEGGQYYYDLALDVSQTAPVEILAGGINIWRSTDQGESWSINAGWVVHGNDSRYVHADVHDIHFTGNKLWIATDGGIFYSNDLGDSMEKKMFGIQGTDFKGFDIGHQDPSVMLGGTFHNSTLLKNGDVFINGWVSTVIGGTGGDNARGFVNPGIKNHVYLDKSGTRGRVVLSDNRLDFHDLFDFDKEPNASYAVGNSCNLAFHPRYYNNILSGVSDQLWLTQDNGSNWELIKSFDGGKIVQIEQSIANPLLIYVVQLFGLANQATRLWKTEDGGSSWEDVSPVFPSNTNFPFQVQINSLNEQQIWLARLPQYASSSSLDGEKTYKSNDGGQTWTNITSSSLDGEMLTNLVHQKGSTGFYLGTRRAVYYKNESLSTWQLYNNNLPLSTFSTKLVPSYTTEKLVNGTNRGVFESPLYEASQPIALPALQQQIIECVLDTAYFSDLSILSNNNVSWSWDFPGGQPSSSTEKTPKVVYNNPGSYDVTLAVNDANGNSSITINSMVNVLPNCSISGVPGNALSLEGSGGHIEAAPIGETLSEMSIMAWIKPSGYQQGNVSIAHWEGSTGNATGLYLDSNNQLKFQWDGNNLNFSSGLIASPDQWSHVSLVIKNNVATIYLNGEIVQKPGNYSAFAFNSPMLSGINATTLGPGFNGLIDELSIWNYALSTLEVRLKRHLTLENNSLPGALSYYQFNTEPGYIPDLVGDSDAIFISDANLSNSDGPYGAGYSEEKMINSAGLFNFSAPMVDLYLNPGQTPNGSVVITRLNLQPDILPQGSPPYSDAYWIVNNYGSNLDFEALGLIQFNNIGFVSMNESMAPEMLMLFKRESNDAGVDWGMPVDMADLVMPGEFGSAGFTNSITNFSQFIISRNVIVPIDFISFQVEKHHSVSALIRWETASEINLNYYEIQRSVDGVHFTTIGKKPAQNNSQNQHEYSFVDIAPGKTLFYYRIKSIDLDGSFQYTFVRNIDFTEIKSIFSVFPNPVRQGGVVQIQTPEDQSTAFKLFDSSGQAVDHLMLNGSVSFRTDHLSSGAYYYVLSNSSLKTSGKLVIQ